MVLFGGFFIAAVVCAMRRDVEAHARLMFLATASVVPAALARVFYWLSHRSVAGVLPGGANRAPPVGGAMMTGLIREFVIVAGVIYDWRRRGRPHPVWLVGAVIITAMNDRSAILRGRDDKSATKSWASFQSQAEWDDWWVRQGLNL